MKVLPWHWVFISDGVHQFTLTRFGLSSFTLLVPTCTRTLWGLRLRRGLTKSFISSTFAPAKEYDWTWRFLDSLFGLMNFVIESPTIRTFSLFCTALYHRRCSLVDFDCCFDRLCVIAVVIFIKQLSISASCNLLPFHSTINLLGVICPVIVYSLVTIFFEKPLVTSSRVFTLARSSSYERDNCALSCINFRWPQAKVLSNSRLPSHLNFFL